MGPTREKAGGERGAAWNPSGIVTLLTDFGTEDPYVGMMKGVILSAAPRAVIVDLSHGVPPQNVRVGAWFLAHAATFFPTGTVHVAVVDPGVGSGRRLLVAEDRGHAYLAPDNGLLGPVLSSPVRGAYSEAGPGELLALVNAYGVLEIAVREGNGAARLGLRQGDTVVLARTS